MDKDKLLLAAEGFARRMQVEQNHDGLILALRILFDLRFPRKPTRRQKRRLGEVW